MIYTMSAHVDLQNGKALDLLKTNPVDVIVSCFFSCIGKPDASNTLL